MRKWIKDMLTDQFGGASSKRVLAFAFGVAFLAMVGANIVTGQDIQEALITACVALILGMVGGSVAEHWSRKIKKQDDEDPPDTPPAPAA